MTYFYSTRTWTGQPQTAQVTDETISWWKHLTTKKNWRIVQLPNGFYQTEYLDLDENWVDVTRRETIESAEASIDGSIEHYNKKLEFLKHQVRKFK